MSLEQQKELESRYVMHTYGRSDVEFVRGDGMTLVGDDGREYRDFLAGIGANCLGYNHPVLTKALEEQGVQVKGSETTMVPTTPTEVSGADAKKVQRLVDRLEELDDVQDVYSTMDMTDEVIAALEEE